MVYYRPLHNEVEVFETAAPRRETRPPRLLERGGRHLNKKPRSL